MSGQRAVRAKSVALPKLLDRLEKFYGKQSVTWPTDPYLFLVWWHCGYPASDAACARGWAALEKAALEKDIGVSPEALLSASPATLARALKAGGMVPELRAQRLKEIAARVTQEFSGDLEGALRAAGPDAARKHLKKFPNIADPGADRILLFAKLAPLAAVPSNSPQVLVRIQRGLEHENYGRTYREAQEGIMAEVAATAAARQRAYLLLKKHGQEICKRTNPKCESCPVNDACAYFAGKRRGRAAEA
jgi:endonuclease III